MRRKSERNKGKASPEKKVEKPTRKSTRRRGKRSPSTSPDRENSNDASSSSTVRESQVEIVSQTPSLVAQEAEKPVEATKSDVAPSEMSIIKEEEEEGTTDAGSVWKVARADASPGEIQKLKLCRQRNMSETSSSDVSSSRKRSNKCHEGGEGITEEIDSADERTAVASSKTAVVRAPTTDEIDSVLQGRDSAQEVSDRKEIPPEIATAELSDVKPNIDEPDQGATNETTIVNNEIARQDDDKPSDTCPELSGDGALSASNVDDNAGDGGKRDFENVAEVIKAEDEASTKKGKVKAKDVAEVKVVANDENLVDRSAKNDNKGCCPEKERAIDDDENNRHDATRSSSDDNDDKAGDKIKNKKRPAPKRQQEATSEDNTDDEENKKGKARRTPLPRTTGRRKHRDKYRDSSNSDTGESDDETERRGKRQKMDKAKDDTKKKTDDDTRNVVESSDDIHPSRPPQIRSNTPVFNETPAESEIKINENNKAKLKNDDNEQLDRIVATAAPPTQTHNNYKPAKVNLKRSFAARPSVETVESKKDTADNETNDFAIHDKENHASGEQNDTKSIPKKRRWGTILAPTDPTPAFSVSTESLKVLVPGAKPLSMNEVRLSKDDDEEKDRRGHREKRYSTSESGNEHKSRDEPKKPKNVESKKDTKGDNHIASRRKISIVKDSHRSKSPSPPVAIPTSILLIKNLVRPFTLNQIRELLSRTGTIVENGFWMDRIKSKCFVEYVNEDQAFETRQALHGISWPISNPKKLQVEYATKEDMELARELSKDQPTSRKTEPLAANDGWQQEWTRDERNNSATKVTAVREWDLGKEDGQQFGKDKERDKKDNDKKRRQRSRSPTLEAHLPAPARKFKKKEDDPPPAKLLDDLFRKTKATPCIYWLPLTNEQIVVKEEMRRQHMAEHARRLEEMRRAERNRDGRRRRSPRK